VFPTTDGRIVFAIPFEQDFTLIGSTERDDTGQPDEGATSRADILYLCRSVGDYLARPVRESDVRWVYSGVRPVTGEHDDEAKSREGLLELETGQAPLLSVLGGRYTAYRQIAEKALAMLTPYLPGAGARAGWTGEAPLPGGDFPLDGYAALVRELGRAFPFLAPAHAARLVRHYGTRAGTILGRARRFEDLGQDFGATLTEAEVEHLVRNEWARCADDIIWRRTKLGLRMTPDQVTRLDRHLVRTLESVPGRARVTVASSRNRSVPSWSGSP
jgi:glycerol-3-phosphate dehydrogenase